MVSNTNSRRSTNLISAKQFISFSFYITCFFKARLRLYSEVFFRSCDISNSNTITENSSSEMESSDYAFEMRLLIVLSAETVNITICSCFSIFNDIFLIVRFPTTRSNPITFDTASIPITAGASTIVERRPTPAIYLTQS